MTDGTPEPAGRPRWRVWGAGAAAAVLVLGTVGGVAWWQGDDRPGLGISQPVDGDLPQPDEGWRYESFGDVVVQVPDSWIHDKAPGRDWCAGGGQGPFPRKPYVDVTGEFVIELGIDCGSSDPGSRELAEPTPERLWTTHLTFQRASEGLAPEPQAVTTYDGWTKIVATVGHTHFIVLADQEHLADAHRIADSAQVVAVDHNGCDATSPIRNGFYPRPPQPFDLDSVGSVDEIAVCQYGFYSPEGEPGLVASRLLTGPEANAELGALQGTTIGSGPNAPDACADRRPDTAVVLRLDPRTEPHDIYVYYESCMHNGFDDGTNVRQLTRENCLPLWGERVRYWGGSGVSSERCGPDS